LADGKEMLDGAKCLFALIWWHGKPGRDEKLSSAALGGISSIASTMM